MDKPRRNSAGRSAGRSSDRNKNTSPSARGAAGRGKSEGKFEKKPFDRDSKKAFGKPDKPAGRTYGDKPAGKSFGAKSAYGKTEKPASGKKTAFEKGGKTDRFAKPGKPRFESEDRARKDDKKTFRKPGASAGKGKKETFLDESKKRTSKPRLKKESAPKFSEKDDRGFPQAGIRLNKFIANSGLCSRREADVMITNGVVTVNGKIMDELGYRVQPDDVVKFDGRTIIPEKPVYLLLNKPKDYITTSEDPQGRRTVMALIQGACKERLYPVGRLDRNTTGLLLFTNDGEMADKLMHPRKRVKKIYSIELDKNVKHEHLQELREGIILEDGPIKPDEVEYTDDKRTIGVEIHSGRNRIVRRMFEHFGYKVVKLDRVYYAGLTKKNLPRGHYRMLEPLEVNMLKML